MLRPGRLLLLARVIQFLGLDLEMLFFLLGEVREVDNSIVQSTSGESLQVYRNQDPVQHRI